MHKSQSNKEAAIQDQPQLDFETVCRTLYNMFQGILSWKWDDRFETALAEFQVDRKDEIRKVVENHLSNTWDNSNIETAPDIVQLIAAQLGSLRGEQLLFTSDPSHNSLLYGAWWPWGSGETISLRIALHDKSLSNTELTELKNQLRSWFAL